MAHEQARHIEPADLVGGWRLECWSLVYEDARPDEYPLGADAQGLILYTPDGHVSATLARRASSTQDAAPVPGMRSFAYAGRYEVKDGCVFHSIEVCTDPALLGLTTMRRIALDGDLLVLQGHDFAAGSDRTQRIAWRRARA